MKYIKYILPCIMIVAIIFAVTACENSNSTEVMITTTIGESSQGQTTITNTTDDSASQSTSIPTASASTEDITNKIALLTKVDGTGEIGFNKTMEEIIKVLDENSISYIKQGNSLEFPNGSGLFDGESITLMKTFEGLCVGDEASRVIELYGEKKAVEFNERIYYTYVYTKPGTLNTDVEFSVCVDGMKPNSKVLSIQINLVTQQSGGAGVM